MARADVGDGIHRTAGLDGRCARMNRPIRLCVLASAVALCAGGCSLMDGGVFSRAGTTLPPAPAAQPPVAVEPVEAVAAPPGRAEFFDKSPVAQSQLPQAVNVFGEFDGEGGAHPGAAPVQLPPRFGPGGFEQVTFVDEGYDTDVEISPDAKWIVFASTRHNERPELYTQKIGGAAVTQLTSDDSEDAFPTFSPDSRRIAFSSTRNGSWDLYVMDADGRNVTQVTATSNMHELHPSFSPDGTRLAYCATGTRSGQWELWIVDLKTMQRRMIGYGLFPVWSPRSDIDQIAFQRARQRGSRWFSLWTADIVDGEAGRLTEVAVSANAAIVSPAWNADGTQIAFSTIVNPNGAQSHRGGTQQDIWVINADGTGRRRITDGNGVNATPSWSSDNRIYFISDRGGCDAIWSARVSPAPPALRARQNQEEPNGATDPFASSSDGN